MRIGKSADGAIDGHQLEAHLLRHGHHHLLQLGLGAERDEPELAARIFGGESGGWGLAELPRGSGKAAAASLRVHQQLDALLQQQQQQQQPQLHQPPPQQKPLGGVVRHLYRTCGGAVLIPVALPQQRLAVFWDAAPVRSAGAAAEAAAPALLPAAVVAAYERWQRNVVALAGWRVCELGAASFLGASGVEGKLRLLRSAGLDRA